MFGTFMGRSFPPQDFELYAKNFPILTFSAEIAKKYVNHLHNTRFLRNFANNLETFTLKKRNMIHDFEEQIKDDLHAYLMAQGEVGDYFDKLLHRLIDAPDIEERWEPIAQSYMADGIREFADYPTVSLGWMMYVGMAVAKMWDEDWSRYSALPDLYLHLRDARGFDAMDEHIREDILHLSPAAAPAEGKSANGYTALERLVGECASRTYSRLRHSGYEDGTKDAFRAYVACLHQLYLMGAAVQLRRLGYRMVKA